MKYNGAVFFDVDGTLIDGAKGIVEPTAKTLEGINILKSKGYLIMISTGRPYSMLDKRLLSIEPNGVIASNGTYAIIDNEVVIDHPMSKKEIENLISIFEKHKIGYVLEGQEKSFIDYSQGDTTLEKVRLFNMDLSRFTTQWDLKDVVAHKLTIFAETKEQQDIVNNISNEYSLMEHTGFTSSDFYRNKYSKGYAIEELLKKLDIPKENTIAFGDGSNDIEMFQVVENGVAMGGAPKELLKHASFQTGYVEEEGIYNGLKKLGLI